MKSRDSRRKLRRYTFQAKMALQNGKFYVNSLPGVVLGNWEEAKAISQRLLEQYRSDPTMPEVEVEPIPHETVSLDLVQMFESLNNQVNIAHKALFVMAERVRLAVSPELTLQRIVDEAIKEATKHANPALRDALESNPEVERQLEAEAEAEAKVGEIRPKRKLGVEAVQEILDNPPEA